MFCIKRFLPIVHDKTVAPLDNITIVDEFAYIEIGPIAEYELSENFRVSLNIFEIVLLLSFG